MVEVAKDLEDYEVTWFYAREVAPAPSAPASSTGSSSTSAAAAKATEAGDTSASSSSVPASADAKEAKKPALEWKPLSVGDSLKLETSHRSLMASTATNKVEIVPILNDLYDVNVGERLGYSVYWNGPAIRVLRFFIRFPLFQPLFSSNFNLAFCLGLGPRGS